MTLTVDDDTKRDTNKLSERQKIIYKMLSTDDTKGETNANALTSSIIAKQLGVSTITVKRELSKMIEMGLIKHVGPTYGGHWKVIK